MGEIYEGLERWPMLVSVQCDLEFLIFLAQLQGCSVFKLHFKVNLIIKLRIA